jgi:hypothetical protein
MREDPLEALILPQLVKKFLPFIGTPTFITGLPPLISVLSHTNPIHILFIYDSLTLLLHLRLHFCLGIPSVLCDANTKTLWVKPATQDTLTPARLSPLIYVPLPFILATFINCIYYNRAGIQT